MADLRVVPRPTLGDVVGGISVALVLIPQSLAYASLADLPPQLGLFAAAFPPLVFALVASSPYLQTGPTALTSLLAGGALAGAGLVPDTESYVRAAALLALIVAGVRLLVGALRLGSVVYLMAEPVTIGFTSGAGVVILASQLPRALGVSLPDDVRSWGNPIRRAAWALTHPDAWTAAAIVLSLITLVVMLGGKRLHRLFPGVLIAVVVAVVYSRSAGYAGPLSPTPEAGWPPLTADLPWNQTGALVAGGLVIALVGFAEPASIARAFATEDRTRWSSSREFVASGLANATAAVSGAYPVGGSFSRSFLNRFAGAETRLSGAVTGLAVLAFLPFAGILDGLPEAVLGAIVIGAVLALVQPRRLARLARRSPWQASLAWITFVATLVVPPNIHYAVILGIALTVVVHIGRPFRIEEIADADGTLRLRPRGLLWVGTNRRLKTRLREIIEADRGSSRVVVDLDRSVAIDAAIADAVAGAMVAAHRAGRSFEVIHEPEGSASLLESFGVAVASD